MLDRIADILSDLTDGEVKPAQINRDTRLIADLDLSSLDVMNAVVTFEEEFDVEIPDDSIPELEPVGDIEDFLKKIVNE